MRDQQTSELARDVDAHSLQRMVVPSRRRLLDLYCCAGGAGEGYRLAGFDVTGVDIRPQLKNPHRFVMADALEYLAEHGHEYDAIHASPPCQAYTKAGKQWRKEGREYPDMIAATRTALEKTGKPWVLENVPGAPLRNPVLLNDDGVSGSQLIKTMNDEHDDSHYDEIEEQREMRFDDYCAMRDWEQGIPDWRDDD